jgi:leucyl-tRNA synthetase
LILLNPFAPHISEELNEKLGYEPITSTPWPNYDETLIVDETITIAVQFNGKTRGTIEILKDAKEADVFKKVEETPFGIKYLAIGELRKIVYIPGRIINMIVS